MAIHGRPFKHELEPIIDYQFKQINRYISDITLGLSKLRDDLNTYIEEEIEREPLNKDSLFNHFDDDIRTYNDDYYNLFISSTFVSIYSLFEMYSGKLCDLAGEKKGARLAISAREQNVIGKHKNYLQETIRLNLTDLQNHWLRIDKEFRVVRNLIVHQNSNLLSKEPSKPLNEQIGYSIIINKSYFQLDEETGAFQIHNPAYLLDISATSKHYLTGVLDKLISIQ